MGDFMERLSKKNKKIIVISVILIFILLASLICFKFLYLPESFEEGINNDPRFMIWYWNYENFIFKNGDTNMPFRLKTPKKVEENKKYPLAIFLHGGGSHGMNNTKQMYADYINSLAKYAPEDCYVLMPQVPVNTRGWDIDMIRTLEKCIDTYLTPNYQIDNDRVYLSGSSMGGHGTIQALAISPTRYAAVMFDAGAIPEKSDENPVPIDIDYSLIKNVPMLISHGRLDDVVPIESILSFTDNLKAAGAKDVTLRIYEDRGHDTIDLFYTEKSHWEWLFNQIKQHN